MDTGLNKVEIWIADDIVHLVIPHNGDDLFKSRKMYGEASLLATIADLIEDMIKEGTLVVKSEFHDKTS